MIQDPVWEQSFPDVGGPSSVRRSRAAAALVRLSAAEAERRREANEERRARAAVRPARARPRAGARLVARAPRRLLLVPRPGPTSGCSREGAREAAPARGRSRRSSLLRGGLRRTRTTAAPPPGRFARDEPVADADGAPLRRAGRRAASTSSSTASTSTPTASACASRLPALPDRRRRSRARARTSTGSRGCATEWSCAASRSPASRAGSQSVLGGQEGRGERRTFRFKPARVVYDDPKTGKARALTAAVVAAARRDLAAQPGRERGARVLGSAPAASSTRRSRPSPSRRTGCPPGCSAARCSAAPRCAARASRGARRPRGRRRRPEPRRSPS